MNIMKEAYKQAKKQLEEDAVMSAADVSPINDVVSTQPTDNSLKPKGAVSDEDVIGKYDPGKGFMNDDNFIIPANVLGKGKCLKRMQAKKQKIKHPKISDLVKKLI